MRAPLILIVGLVTLINLSANADVYKTKDKQGRTVYTDQPAADDTKAKLITLPSINELPPVQTIPVEDIPPAAPDIHYKVDISSPASGARLLPNERNLNVSVSIDQSLRPGYFFAYFLNGEKVNETSESTITITEPPRGENKLYVQVVNEYGKSFGESESIIFYVMRPTVKH